MRVTVVYEIDGTTHTDRYTAPRISTQILAGGRGVVKTFDGAGNRVEIKIYAHVYTMETVYNGEDSVGQRSPDSP